MKEYSVFGTIVASYMGQNMNFTVDNYYWANTPWEAKMIALTNYVSDFEKSTISFTLYAMEME